MYVVTFYSFKGGVGRSMALVNVASDLVKRGKKVLIVDFDLEAPGLDTFDTTRSAKQGRGLLEFVCEFRSSGDVQDAQEYMYCAENDPAGGQLWVMPAGEQNADYHNRFKSVDWAELYENFGGFLLFEDLKEQWRSTGFDYVLIDSRTGHTDVAGICTRHLPDAVVILFFPNEQNRRGLELIVEQIRGEASPPRKRKILIHFVMSNVPDLDDEDEILRNEIRKFEQSLTFGSPTVVIHHYDSMALLDQVTFARARPRSRLAKEYSELADAIVKNNLEDRVGALAFLDQVRARLNTDVDLEEPLQSIRVKHSSDTDVLAMLSSIRARQLKSEEALSILTDALNAQTRERPDLRLRRARLFINSGQTENAISDLRVALTSADLSAFDLCLVIRMLRRARLDMVPLIAPSPALDKVEPDRDLTGELQSSPETLSLSVKLLNRWLSDFRAEETQRLLRIDLSLSLIGMGSYRGVLDMYGGMRLKPDGLQTPECFNYSMALWGLEGAVPMDYLAHLSSETDQIRRERDPNRLQCFALINRLIGNGAVAFELLALANQVTQDRGAMSFSCWSYLKVSVERFKNDLEQMRTAFAEDAFLPEFIRRNSHLGSASAHSGT